MDLHSELQKIKISPNKYIMDWMEGNLIHVGARVMKLLSLQPCSLILPDIIFSSNNIKSSFNILYISNPSAGKSSICKKYSDILNYSEEVYHPYVIRDVTTAKLQADLAELKMFTLIIEDFSQIGGDYETIKVIEGATGDERCCHEKTRVLLADGSLKTIKDLQVGEELISFNNNLELEKSRIVEKIKTNPEKYLKIKTRTSEILVTPNHKFFVLEGKDWKSVESTSLKKGDFIPIPLKVEKIINEFKEIFTDEKERRIQITKDGVDLIKNKIGEKRYTDSFVCRKIGRCVSYLQNIFKSKFERIIKDEETIDKLCEVLNLQEFKNNEKYFKRLFTMPEKFSLELCEILGYYWGDGNFDSSKRMVYLTDKDLSNLNYYNSLIKNLFKTTTIIRNRHKLDNSTNRLFIHNSDCFFNLIKKLGIKRSKFRSLPDILYSFNNIQLSAFIRGYFDAESSVRVSTEGGEIILETSCEDATLQLRNLLLRFGILSAVRKRERIDTRFKEQKYISYQIQISDRDSVVKYKSYIGFNHPEKIKKLNTSVENGQDGHRLYYRYKSKIVFEIMDLLELNMNDVFKKTNIRMNEFKTGKYNIPLKTLRKLRDYFEEKIVLYNGINKEQALISFKFLDNLVKKSDSFTFDEIISIEEIKNTKEENFWDISLDRNYNFIANGLFTHNSISKKTMRDDIDTKVRSASLLAGTWTDLNRYFESFKSGLFFRNVLLFIDLSDKEQEDIGKFINKGIGNSESSEISNIREQVVKKYYAELSDIQSGEHNTINTIKGYKFDDELKNKIFNAWNKKITDAKTSFGRTFKLKLEYSFSRELHQTYAFLVSNAFLNIFNRKIEDGILYPNEEDCQLSLELMNMNLNNKLDILKSKAFLNVSSFNSLRNVMESNIPEKTKKILMNLASSRFKNK